MPRRSNTRSRPATTQRREASTQKRNMTTAPTPAAPVAPPVAQPGTGMLGQIASVAVGSAIGHTVGRMITGGISAMSGSDHAPSYESSDVCQDDSKAFMQCMSENDNNISACQFYLDMLKSCQQRTASQ